MRCNLFRVCVLGLVSLALAACGGESRSAEEIIVVGDDEDDPVEVVEIVVPSIPERDGYIGHLGGLIGFVELHDGVLVGDGEVGPVLVSYAGFLSFDLSDVPPGAEILSAELAVEQVGSSGAPFALLGRRLLVDHVEIDAGLEPGLDVGDAEEFPLTTYVGSLSSDPTPGLRTLEVKMQVQADVEAGRPTSDYRLRFPHPWHINGASDHIGIADADGSASTAEQPGLRIGYRIRP